MNLVLALLLITVFCKHIGTGMLTFQRSEQNIEPQKSVPQHAMWLFLSNITYRLYRSDDNTL